MDQESLITKALFTGTKIDGKPENKDICNRNKSIIEFFSKRFAFYNKKEFKI